MQNTHHPDLLHKIDAFLTATGMGDTYFGKKVVGNSELVKRLRANGRVWPETEQRVRDFIDLHTVALEVSQTYPGDKSIERPGQ